MKRKAETVGDGAVPSASESLWRPAFPLEEFEARQARIAERMGEAQLDVLIASDPANMNYTTGYDGGSYYVPQYALVFAKKGNDSKVKADRVMLILRGMDLDGAKRTTHMSPTDLVGYRDTYVHNKEGHHAIEVAIEHIAKWGSANGYATLRIGIGEMDKMDAETYLALQAKSAEVSSVALKVVDSNLLINRVRLVKSELELGHLRRAAGIADHVMATALKEIRAGRRQCEVAAEVCRAQAWGNPADDGGRHGGDASSLLPTISTGIDASCAHLPWTDGVMPAGTGTFLELSGVYRKYTCPIARTVFLRQSQKTDVEGSGDSALYESFTSMHRAVSASLSAAVAHCIPGNTAESVFWRFNEVLKEHGVPEKASRLGYSIGIGYPPDWGERTISVRTGDKTVLEKNMVLHLIAGMWQTDRGYELSEALVISDNGAPELLCKTPRELFVIEEN